ncbi:4Fe-4S dicluster domain-containing protein [Maledivibacter halophilus]|uniref:4Fe-4S binding domain-containing protein n=1 Tax=Maledivibacter halophilus TaxID=36842 RepID=A0A1T5IK54_9FIRM|nr:4Fe-4S dicluster domain-containing protein [Maledivibacter halophilus]SKC39535.1 4Fe-4S binding domain-containing protein [Maledivibacter halophilus]
MFKKTGIASNKMIEKLLPSAERRKKGPYAIFECFQEIPCNPCFTSCRVGAVEAFEDINHIPKVHHEKCSGCGLCVSACPGLACFVIDETYSDTEVLIKIPYEFLPLPKTGETVNGLDREGNIVTEVKVIKVQNNKKLDNTNVITIAVPKKFMLDVRNIQVGRE